MRNFAGVIAFLTVSGAFAGWPVAGQQSSAGASAITDASKTEAVQFLTDLVRIDTSNPPGNEVKAANYIKSVLDKEGIPSEIFESAPGRGESGRTRSKGNAQQTATDAHGASGRGRGGTGQWTVDPFAAILKDGYLYGRGSHDDKAMDAANLEVFLELHRRKIPLDRDVILLAEAAKKGQLNTASITWLRSNGTKLIANMFSTRAERSTRRTGRWIMPPSVRQKKCLAE